MKSIRIALLAIPGIAVPIGPALTQKADCGRICLYDKQNFGGQARCFTNPLTVEDLRRNWSGFMPRSARLSPGKGCRLTLNLFESKGAKGHSVVVVDQNPDLTRNPVIPPEGYGSLTIRRYGPNQ